MVPFESFGTVSYSIATVYPLHSTPPLVGGGVPVVILPCNYTVWQTRVVKKIDMFTRFDRIPACDRRTDRQTDGQMVRQISCDSIVHAVHTIAR